MTDILFKCPHCNQDITKESFNNNHSNWTVIQNYLNDLKDKQELKLKESIKAEIFDQTKVKESLLKEELKNFYSEEINKLNEKILMKDYELNNFKQEQSLVISNEKQLIENNYLEKIKTLELLIEQKKGEIQNLSLAKDLEFQTKESLLVNSYEKRIHELEQANREYKIINSKRKGENFEHEVEQELRKAFGLFDSIEKITTGDKKADYVQTIKNIKKEEIGKIVYEVKNAEWSSAWINKLSTDVANNKTKYGILIATSFNDKYPGIPFIRSEEFENIWITDSESFVFVGQIVRRLIEFENEYNLKFINLTNSTDNKVIAEMEKQKQKLNEYWTIYFPESRKKIQKEIENLEMVERSLESNSNKIKKSVAVINQQFFNKIYKGLSSILGDLDFGEE